MKTCHIAEVRNDAPSAYAKPRSLDTNNGRYPTTVDTIRSRGLRRVVTTTVTSRRGAKDALSLFGIAATLGLGVCEERGEDLPHR